MLVFGTADDVFSMAVRIEENGRDFYSGAAAKTTEPTTKKLFEALAEMEAGHIEAFKSLRKSLGESVAADAVWDPEGLAESYLQVTADTHVFTLKAAGERVKQITTPLEVIDVALQFEKDSVAFFMGMKDILDDQKGKDEVEVLVQVEKEHIQMLLHARRQFEKTGEAHTHIK